jgi:hypothetical protein
MTEQLEEAKRAVHAALQAFLDEGEIAVHWALTIEVARPDGGHHLDHRSGGGIDEQNNPMAWTYLGMLEASTAIARRQLVEDSKPPPDPSEADE